MSRINNQTDLAGPGVFEGTDAIAQNRKVAVQRVVEMHDALEAGSTRGSESSAGSTTSADPFGVVYDTIHLPDAEVRAFRHFLRKWDHNETPDPEFDHVVRTCSIEFEALTIRHFFRRIALWHESEEILQAAKKEMAKREKREKTRNKDSALGKIWMRERENHEVGIETPLKEVTTREGLAQLLWTLMNDRRAPLAPVLFREGVKAVKEIKYGMV